MSISLISTPNKVSYVDINDTTLETYTFNHINPDGLDKYSFLPDVSEITIEETLDPNGTPIINPTISLQTFPTIDKNGNFIVTKKFKGIGCVRDKINMILSGQYYNGKTLTEYSEGFSYTFIYANLQKAIAETIYNGIQIKNKEIHLSSNTPITITLLKNNKGNNIEDYWEISAIDSNGVIKNLTSGTDYTIVSGTMGRAINTSVSGDLGVLGSKSITITLTSLYNYTISNICSGDTISSNSYLKITDDTTKNSATSSIIFKLATSTIDNFSDNITFPALTPVITIPEINAIVPNTTTPINVYSTNKINIDVSISGGSFVRTSTVSGVTTSTDLTSTVKWKDEILNRCIVSMNLIDTSNNLIKQTVNITSFPFSFTPTNTGDFNLQIILKSK